MDDYGVVNDFEVDSAVDGAEAVKSFSMTDYFAEAVAVQVG